MATQEHFAIVKGEDVQIDWTIRQSDSETAAAQDITGWTFSFKVKRTDADSDPNLVTPTIAITDAVQGAVRVTIAAVQTASLQGDYRHSLWRTNAGSLRCLSQGFLSVLDSTQDA